jgi:multidrug resistance protein, MATE family
MSLVDTAVLGRLDAASLGGAGIAGAIYFLFTLLGMGCVTGMDPLVAQAVGAGDPVRARRVLWQALRIAVLVGVPLSLVALLVPAVLIPVGVDPPAARVAALLLPARVPGMVPFLLFSALRSYLQGMSVTRPILLATVVSTAVNLLLIFPLVLGDGALRAIGVPGIGLPRLGAVGAGIANSVATTVGMLVVAVALRHIPAPPDPARRRRDPALLRLVFRLGLPVGLQLVAELGALTAFAVMAGMVSSVAAAAHQVALTLASFSFTVALGISQATSVLVGRAVGAGDQPGARRAGLLGIGAASAFMALAGLAFLLLAGPLARLLSDRPTVVVAAIPLVMIAAVFQIFDGAQVVAAGALRGAGDTRPTFFANLAGHYGVGIPLGVLLAFGLGMGTPGLWWGSAAGLACVGIALVARFLWLSARPIARV